MLTAESYCTDTVTPVWLMFGPTYTAIEFGMPDWAVNGICTLSCISPAARPGAYPA